VPTDVAWTEPDWLAEEPLKALVAKGSGFSEKDKATILGEHQRLEQAFAANPKCMYNVWRSAQFSRALHRRAIRLRPRRWEQVT
jgi:hypothetical protein